MFQRAWGMMGRDVLEGVVMGHDGTGCSRGCRA